MCTQHFHSLIYYPYAFLISKYTAWYDILFSHNCGAFIRDSFKYDNNTFTHFHSTFYNKAEKIVVHSEKRVQELLTLGIKGVEESNLTYFPLGVDKNVFFPEEKEIVCLA